MSEFKVGDPVKWVHSTYQATTRSARMGLTVREGFIHEIDEATQRARCRIGRRGRKDYWLPLALLVRPEADPLRRLAEGLAQAQFRPPKVGPGGGE